MRINWLIKSMRWISRRYAGLETLFGCLGAPLPLAPGPFAHLGARLLLVVSLWCIPFSGLSKAQGLPNYECRPESCLSGVYDLGYAACTERAPALSDLAAYLGKLQKRLKLHRTRKNKIDSGRYRTKLKQLRKRKRATLAMQKELLGCSSDISTPIATPIPPSQNSAPSALNASIQSYRSLRKTITLQASDPDGDPLIFSIVSAPQRGALKQDGNRVTYSPPIAFVGQDSFVFRVTDPGGEAAQAQINLDVLPLPSEATPIIESLPRALVQFDDDAFEVIDNWTDSGGAYVRTTSNCSALLRRSYSDFRWTLELRNLSSQGIKDVWFPYPQYDDGHSELILPFILGVRNQNHDEQSWDWNMLQYPGGLTAPVGISTFSNGAATLMAAANYPPKTVEYMYAKGGTALRYYYPIAPGGLAEYSYITARSRDEPRYGLKGWQVLADLYRGWLEEHLSADSKVVSYPEWLRVAEGMLNFQLENQHCYNLALIQQRWQTWSPVFPWMQFWGQMSTYAGDPGISCEPPQPGEAVGCCLFQFSMHSRYVPSLIEFVQQLTTQGAKIGYYTRSYIRQDLPPGAYDLIGAEEYLAPIQEWAATNHNLYGASTNYIDVIGRTTPRRVDAAPLFAYLWNTFPENTLNEGTVDVYPQVGLVSGALDAASTLGGSSELGLTPLISPNKKFLLGISNGGHRHEGAENEYRSERATFLHGMSFDVNNPADPAEPSRLRPYIARTLEERKRVGWYELGPVGPLYRDTWGLSDVPQAANIRRFITNSGQTLLAVDNWGGLPQIIFKLDGEEVIIDVPKQSDGSPQVLFLHIFL